VPKYEYNGDSELVFPTLGITANKGDSFDGPEGLTAQGLSLSSSARTAPAVSANKSETPFKPNAKDGDKDGFVQDNTVHERPVVKSEIKSSALPDTTAGA
jgi:hypothetical protein